MWPGVGEEEDQQQEEEEEDGGRVGSRQLELDLEGIPYERLPSAPSSPTAPGPVGSPNTRPAPRSGRRQAAADPGAGAGSGEEEARPGPSKATTASPSSPTSGRGGRERGEKIRVVRKEGGDKGKGRTQMEVAHPVQRLPAEFPRTLGMPHDPAHPSSAEGGKAGPDGLRSHGRHEAPAVQQGQGQAGGAAGLAMHPQEPGRGGGRGVEEDACHMPHPACHASYAGHADHAC